MATITPTITAEQLYTNGGGVTTNFSGYVGYGGSVSNKLYSCRLAFSPAKTCSKIVLGISAKSNGAITSSNVNFRAAVYTSKKYPTSATWAGDTPNVGSIKSFAMSTQSTSGGTTTGSVEITGTFTAGTTYYLNVWHYTSTIEYFYDASWTLTGTVQTYTVSYDANGGTGAPSAQTKDYGDTLTLSNTSPTRTGYTFQGWGTSSSATTATYQPGGSYTANASATLYAVWQVITYTVSYNGNAKSGATVSGLPSSQTKTYGTNLTLSSTKPTSTSPTSTFSVTYNANSGSTTKASDTITKTQPYSFNNWNTAANGSGSSYSSGGTYSANAAATLYAQWTAGTATYTKATMPTTSQCTRTGYDLLGFSTSNTATTASYTPGTQYTFTSATTLYAVWKEKTYTVSYNANGGSGAPSAQTKYYFSNLTLSSTVPTQTGYDFLGWATSASGAVAYQPGGTYSTNAAVTLYAKWQLKTYTISYNANGGTGAPASQTKTYGATLTLSSTKPTRASQTAATYTVTYNGNGGTSASASDTATKQNVYSFKNWNTAANGSGTSYASGGAYTANAAATLYAQWNMSSPVGSVTLPTATRSGYTHLGWATSAGATTAQWAPGASYTPTGNVTLYAVWKAQSLTNIGNGSGFNQYQIYIANGTGFDLYIAYIADGSSWKQYM